MALGNLPLKQKIHYLNQIRGHYSAIYLDVKKGTGHVEKLKIIIDKHAKVISKDLRHLYMALVKKIGPLSNWVEKAQKLRTVKKGRLSKAYVKGGTADPEMQDKLFQQMVAAANLDGSSYDPYLNDIDDDYGQEANDAAELSLMALGASAAIAMSIGLTGKKNATDAEIQAAWKAQFPKLSIEVRDQLSASMETTLKTIAGLTLNASDPDEAMDMESLSSAIDDLIGLQAETVAETSSSSILARVEMAAMEANGLQVDQWVTHPERTKSGPCQVCIGNEASGPDEGGMFESQQFGQVKSPPAHNHCECTTDSTKGEADLENLQPPSEIAPEEDQTSQN